MATFRVWAPGRARVELELDGRRLEMHAERSGWWALEVAAPSDAEYGFALDGGPVRPDPRSPWQPHGVHGRSRRVDHAAFAWTDAGWQPPPLAQAVIYELHVGTFTPAGTFRAVIDRLDDLVDLGVTHVELMPVNEFSGCRGWGYDGVDLYAPHHSYGGPVELKRLVDAAHRRGLAVVLDVVYNHLGPAGNYLAELGPYFTDRYRTPWGPAVNYDGPGSDEVRRFVCDNACMWLRDYHIDALRIDAVHALIDLSARHILEQLATEVDALARELGRPLALIAESDLNDPRVVRPRGQGGYGIDAQWADDFHHALHAVLTGERNGYYADFGRLADIATALREAYVYAGRYSSFRQRAHGRPATGVPGTAFVGFLQNHDQIGNRARGERSGHLMSSGRAMIGAALVLTAPFIPMLFQGEEWGASAPFQYFTAHPDPALAARVREGRRHEFAAFGWDADAIPDPQDAATFQRSKLDWTERSRPPHRERLAWYRALIHLRRRTQALLNGVRDHVRPRWDEQARWMTIERGPIVLAVNLADRTQAVPLPEGAGEVVLASADIARADRSALWVPADAVAIVQVR